MQTPEPQGTDINTEAPLIDTSKPSRAREIMTDDTGAATAEYVVVVLAAVAFAGVLIAIIRSSEVQSMLLDIVQRALGQI